MHDDCGDLRSLGPCGARLTCTYGRTARSSYNYGGSGGWIVIDSNQEAKYNEFSEIPKVDKQTDGVRSDRVRRAVCRYNRSVTQ